LMRREMKASSFRMWRKRMTGRTTKHRAVQQVRMQAKVRGAVQSAAAFAEAPLDVAVEMPAELALTHPAAALTAATEVTAAPAVGS
ncbi:MAG: TIGR03643 family protein, partial [Burkholderiaceae bacterium]|nr:TIGR03643 family protein [Burkholderiaceae bacterium]